MQTALLTGFEPFGGDRLNPSGEAVRMVAAAWEGPDHLVTDVLPVAFDAASQRLRHLIDTHQPDVILATGLAGGRSAITPERLAINLADARIPDNAGAQPLDSPCAVGGPAAYFATVPVKAIVAALTDEGIPAALSHSAGTFVCNHVFYLAAHHAAARGDVRVGFVHVPWARGQAPQGESELPLTDIARGLDRALRVALNTTADAALIGGLLH